MGFFKKLLGSQKEELPNKKIKKRTKKKPKKSSSEKSDELLEAMDLIIDDAKKMLVKSPKTEILQNESVSIVEGFFYSNLINNFKGNLIEENLKEYDINEKELKQIQKKFKDIFKKCVLTLESGSNKGQIDYNEYKIFRKNLNLVSNGAYKLLIELEEHVNLNSCEKKIENFKKEVLNFGREFKVGDDGSFGLGGYEGQGDEDNEEFKETSNEISNFNKFNLELENNFEEDINTTFKNIRIEDEKGHFFGSYYQSKNKKYIVAYSDAYGKKDKKGNDKVISGQVYLIKDEKRILWKKNIDRPNSALVNDVGVVIVIDWISFGGALAGKVHFFNEKGKKLSEHKFDYNIGGQAISETGKEIIVTTCFPDNSIYLFNVLNQKLIKKAKNTSSQKPLSNFKFEEVKKLIK